MRLYTPEENRIIKNIVDIFREAKPGSLVELQVARLLRKKLNFFALKWSINPKDDVTIYIPETDAKEDDKVNKLYFDIANFIYLIEELEERGFIKLQKIPSSKENDSTILYDKKLYTYDEKDNTFWADVSIKNGTKTIHGKAVVPLHGWKTINTSFAKDLQRCASSIVYPLPLAIDYVNNGFETLEQRQFRTQMETAIDSAKSSRRAAIFGFFSTFIALGALVYTIWTKHDPTTIDDNNLERIETAIKSNRISEPIEIITNDTVVVNQVEPAQKKK